jgi:hypothetical protein
MPLGIGAHFISSGWSLFLAMATLPQVLRNIRIELIEAPSFAALEGASRHAPQSTGARERIAAEGETK